MIYQARRFRLFHREVKTDFGPFSGSLFYLVSPSLSSSSNTNDFDMFSASFPSLCECFLNKQSFV